MTGVARERAPRVSEGAPERRMDGITTSLQGGSCAMLVLTRRIGEEVLIAGDICVTVVSVKGDRVRLGITAPSSVAVTRRELLAECSEDAGATTRGRPALQTSVALRIRGDT
jgi:carbon storage regulator